MESQSHRRHQSHPAIDAATNGTKLQTSTTTCFGFTVLIVVRERAEPTLAAAFSNAAVSRRLEARSFPRSDDHSPSRPSRPRRLHRRADAARRPGVGPGDAPGL